MQYVAALILWIAALTRCVAALIRFTASRVLRDPVQFPKD
jgi:hypothetical protein